MAKATALQDTAVPTEDLPTPEAFIASFPPVQGQTDQVFQNGPLTVTVTNATGVTMLTCPVDPTSITINGLALGTTIAGTGASGAGVSLGGMNVDVPVALASGTYVVGAYFEGTCPVDTISGWKAPTQTIPAGIRPTPKTFFTTTISVPTR